MDKRIKDLFLYNHYNGFFSSSSTNQPNVFFLTSSASQISSSTLNSTNHSTITSNLSVNISFDALEEEFTFNNFHEYLGSSYSVIYLTILIITCIEILIGNSLLIYAVFSNKLFGNKLTTNHVIFSLAISDLLIGILIMPYYIFTRFYKINDTKSWHYEVWSNLGKFSLKFEHFKKVLYNYFY